MHLGHLKIMIYLPFMTALKPLLKGQSKKTLNNTIHIHMWNENMTNSFALQNHMCRPLQFYRLGSREKDVHYKVLA